MVRKQIGIILFVVLLFVTQSVIAAASETGTLSATGKGTPRLYMSSGSVTLTGDGPLLVSANAKVSFTTKQEHDMTPIPGKLAGKDMVQYKYFNGTAVITGEHFSAGMYGRDFKTTELKVEAKGAGYAILLGEGSFVLADDSGSSQPTKGEWTQPNWSNGKQADLKAIEIKIGSPDAGDDPVPSSSAAKH